MQEMNYSAALGYQKNRFIMELFHSYFNTDIAIFAGSHIGNLSDLYQAFQAQAPLDSSGFSYKLDLPYQHIVHRLSKLSASYQLKRLGRIKFIYAFQNNIRKEFDRNIAALQSDGRYKPSLHFALNTHNYHLNFEHSPFKKWSGEVGFDGMLQNNQYYGSYFIPNFQKRTGGVYLTEKWHHHAFSAEGGFR